MVFAIPKNWGSDETSSNHSCLPELPYKMVQVWFDCLQTRQKDQGHPRGRPRYVGILGRDLWVGLIQMKGLVEVKLGEKITQSTKPEIL